MLSRVSHAAVRRLKASAGSPAAFNRSRVGLDAAAACSSYSSRYAELTVARAFGRNALSPNRVQSHAFSSLPSAFRSTVPRCMPIKSVEVMSIVGSSGDKGATATLDRILTPPGSFVMAGDVVAVLQSTGRSNSLPSSSNSGGNNKVEIRSPSTGKIVDVNFQLQDTVKLGDILFTVDTDAESQSIKDAQLLSTHIQANMSSAAPTSSDKSGSVSTAFVDDTWFKETFLTLDDPQRLTQLAHNIRDRLPPQLLPKALAAMERVLQIYQENKDTTPATSVAQAAHDIGLIYHQLGDLQSAIVQFDFALKIRQEIFGEDGTAASQDSTLTEASSPASLIGTNHVLIGATYNQMGNFASALPHFEQALAIQRQIKSSAADVYNPVNMATAHHNLGATHLQMGTADKALENYLDALRVYKDMHGESIHSDVAMTHHNVSMAYKQVASVAMNLVQQQPDAVHTVKANYEKALEHAQAALQMYQDLKLQTADVASCHSTLGQLYAEMDQVDAAKEQYEASLDAYEATFGPNSPMTALGHSNLGALQYQIRNFEEALASYKKSLDILQAVHTLQKNHPDLAVAHNNVGLAHYQLQNFKESYDSHQQAKAILDANADSGMPINPSTMAMTIGSLGNALKSLERFDEALGYYQRAHKMLVEEVYKGDGEKAIDHPDIGSSHNNIGMIYCQQGRLEEGLQEYKAARDIFANCLGDSHPHTGSCHFNIGLIQQEIGNYDASAMEFELARLIWSSSLGPDHQQTALAVGAKKELDELKKQKQQ